MRIIKDIIEKLRSNLVMLKDKHQIDWTSFCNKRKVKNTVPWTYVINDVNDEEIIGTFYEKELQKTNQQEFRVEKVISK